MFIEHKITGHGEVFKTLANCDRRKTKSGENHSRESEGGAGQSHGYELGPSSHKPGASDYPCAILTLILTYTRCCKIKLIMSQTNLGLV